MRERESKEVREQKRFIMERERERGRVKKLESKGDS